MGTINYKTSDYITLAINTANYFDNYYDDLLELDYTEAAGLLDQYDFYYYHVTIEPGYYEGFSLNIEANFPVFFDDHAEKLEAQKEITEIKNLLYDLVKIGLVACFPGWCTGYKTHDETKAEIKKAIKEMREEVKTTPTYYQLKRAGEIA